MHYILIEYIIYFFILEVVGKFSVFLYFIFIKQKTKKNKYKMFCERKLSLHTIVFKNSISIDPLIHVLYNYVSGTIALFESEIARDFFMDASECSFDPH